MISISRHKHDMNRYKFKKQHFLAAKCFFIILLTLTPGVKSQSFDLTYSIKEELPIGSLVGHIGQDSNISRLLSVEDYSTLSFRLSALTSDKSDYFNVNELTGALSVAKTIDREKECFYELKCELTLHVSAQTAERLQFYSFTIHVLIEDVNDNTPYFPLDHMTMQIDEDTPLHSAFLIAAAVDGDIENNTVQRYMLKMPSDVFDLQVSRNLDESLVPQLYVKAALDRETRPYYFLHVVAMDGGKPRRSGEMKVNVTLNDVNDNAPKFSQRIYDKFVKEVVPVNTKIMTLKASDLDTGKNAMIRFRLGRRQSESSFNSFKVDAHSGAIITLRDLTEFQGKTMKLVVEAEDNGDKPMIAQAQVNIHVTDSENNAPAISFTLPDSSSRHTRVPENATMGLVIAHFLVKDSDSGNEGKVHCEITNARDIPFRLYKLAQKEYKVSVHGTLDRETTSSYTITLTCRDEGSPPRYTDFDFQVVLEDVNDNAPVFYQHIYNASIIENMDSRHLLRVKANDSDTSPNNKVTYRLGNVTALVNTYIQVNPRTGDISTRQGLDRELFKQLDFLVEAVDSGHPPMTSACRVIINVKDQNDNHPSITQENAQLSVRENMPVGTVVGKIDAKDPDEGPSGQISYQLLTDNDGTKLFNLTYNGILSTLKVFDREAQDIYDINVVARDYGSHPKTNILHIRVMISDDNDHRPIFEFPRIGNNDASVTLSARANATVAKIFAKDDDVGENATLTYTIIDGASDVFEIEPNTGRIYTLRRLYTRDKGPYEVSLFVRDNGPFPRSTTSTVTLYIRQGNYTAAATGTTKNNHIVIAAILVGATVFIAIIVLIVVLRVIRKDRRDRRAKYTGGLPMQVKSHTPTDDDSDEGPWRRYDDKQGNGPTCMPVDPSDDIIMFKMKLADQYKELEPEDKDHAATMSRFEGMVNRDGGDIDGAPDVTRTKSGTRLATFQAKLTPYGTTDQKIWRAALKDKMADEMLSSSSRETSGADSGRGPSEDGSQGYNDDPRGNRGHTTKVQVNQNGATGHTLLMTFQSDGQNFDPRQESRGVSPNTSPLPSRRGHSPIPFNHSSLGLSRGNSPLPSRHELNLGFPNLGSNVDISKSTGNLSQKGYQDDGMGPIFRLNCEGVSPEPNRRRYYAQGYTDEEIDYGGAYGPVNTGSRQNLNSLGATGFALVPEQYVHQPSDTAYATNPFSQRGVQESSGATLCPAGQRPLFVGDDMIQRQTGGFMKLPAQRVAFGTSCPQLFVDDPALLDAYNQPMLLVTNRSRSFYNHPDAPGIPVYPMAPNTSKAQNMFTDQQNIVPNFAPGPNFVIDNPFITDTSMLPEPESVMFQDCAAVPESADTTVDDMNTTTTSGSYTIDQDEETLPKDVSFAETTA